MNCPILQKIVDEQFGFVTSADVEELSKVHPSLQILVRTGMNRYVCGIGNLKEIISKIESKGDYIRDVGLTSENYNRIKKGQKPYTMSRIHQVHPDM